MDSALNLPQQQVADLDPLQKQALALAPQMFGSFHFMQSAGQRANAGTFALAGGLGMLSDPTRSVGMFMSPYETEVVIALWPT